MRKSLLAIFLPKAHLGPTHYHGKWVVSQLIFKFLLLQKFGKICDFAQNYPQLLRRKPLPKKCMPVPFWLHFGAKMDPWIDPLWGRFIKFSEGKFDQKWPIFFENGQKCHFGQKWPFLANFDLSQNWTNRPKSDFCQILAENYRPIKSYRPGPGQNNKNVKNDYFCHFWQNCQKWSFLAKMAKNGHFGQDPSQSLWGSALGPTFGRTP